MGYDVRLGGGEPKERFEVEGFLESLPDVRRGANKLLYTDPEEDVTTEIKLIGGTRVEGLDVLVPVAVSRSAADRIASLCMGLANRFGWSVQDAASGAHLVQTDLVRRFSGAGPAGAKAGGCFSVMGLLPLAAALVHHLR